MYPRTLSIDDELEMKLVAMQRIGASLLAWFSVPGTDTPGAPSGLHLSMNGLKLR